MKFISLYNQHVGPEVYRRVGEVRACLVTVQYCSVLDTGCGSNAMNRERRIARWSFPPTLDPKGLIFVQIQMALVPSKSPFQIELSSEDEIFYCRITMRRKATNGVSKLSRWVSTDPTCTMFSTVSSFLHRFLHGVPGVPISLAYSIVRERIR